MALSHDAQTTLKLICNFWGVRGTGKFDKEGFYKAAFWLHQNHIKTLVCNATSVAQIGFFKNLREILYRLIEGQEVRENQKADWLQKKKSPKQGKRGEAEKKKASIKPAEVRVMKDLERGKLEKAKASALRRESSSPRPIRLLKCTKERVSDVFTQCLKHDIENLKSSKKNHHFTLQPSGALSSTSSTTALHCCVIALRGRFPQRILH
ncbi:hypothetical protein DVH24_015834 [Malus domestica]|uniref:DUF2828 domain-containing protein n=1 Tax=Malus domestica TaxID=3750 RepID=A0A498JG39_MALDO|nr:hypothetical protein DVH24_015834 [Malus domestica]